VCCRSPIRRFHHTTTFRPFITIEQEAKLLQIVRSKAYELAAERERTPDLSGLPAIRIGHQKRVPRAALERYINGLLNPVRGVPPHQPLAPPSGPERTTR